MIRHCSARQLFIAVALAVFAISGFTTSLRGFATVGHTWATNQVYYYVNTQSVTNSSPSAIIDAVQRGAAPWTTQTNANIQLMYAGTTTGSSLSLNYKNEVFFRNDSAAYAAETYWYYDATGRLVDFDIVLHEGSVRYFAGSGCTGAGLYIEDMTVHEFGHGLGLGHSPVLGATMNTDDPMYCDMRQMTLEADDIAGVESLYPSSGGSSSTLPSAPAAPSQLGVTPTGTNPTGSLSLSWSDRSTNEAGFNLERSQDGVWFGQLAELGPNVRSFTDTGLAAGTVYYYRVNAFNSAGTSSFSNVAAGQTQAVAQAPATGSPSPSLTATASKGRGAPTATLRWNGFGSGTVDVYRNGARIMTTPNDGVQGDSLKKGTTGTFSYQLCEAGTSTCSNVASLTF